MCIRYYIDHKETSRILLSFCQQLRKVFSTAFQNGRSNKYIDGEGVRPSDFFFISDHPLLNTCLLDETGKRDDS